MGAGVDAGAGLHEGAECEGEGDGGCLIEGAAVGAVGSYSGSFRVAGHCRPEEGG